MNARPGRRLRVTIVLDSCYSGAFLTDFLEGCLTTHSRELMPFACRASSMHDEVSWEESELGHGLYTYCASVRPARDNLATLAATAIQADNTRGPSLWVAEGAYGCAILTGGEQNPVEFDLYDLNACGESLTVSPVEGQPMRAGQMRFELAQIRDSFKKELAPFLRRRRMRGQQSDDEIRAEVRKIVGRKPDYHA